jgi:hypothetical protein
MHGRGYHRTNSNKAPSSIGDFKHQPTDGFDDSHSNKAPSSIGGFKQQPTGGFEHDDDAMSNKAPSSVGGGFRQPDSARDPPKQPSSSSETYDSDDTDSETGLLATLWNFFPMFSARNVPDATENSGGAGTQKKE